MSHEIRGVNRPGNIKRIDYLPMVKFNVTISAQPRRVRHFILLADREKVFFNGDLILYIPGLEYPVNMTKHDLVICPCCGTVKPAVNTRCVGVDCRMVPVRLSFCRKAQED